MSRADAINLAYLVTIVTFILALRFLSSPAHARLGTWFGAAGMAIAVAATFAQPGLHNYASILIVMAVFTPVGWYAARAVKMTAMPQKLGLLIALILGSLLFGVLFVLPIGGADMPVVISLLNAFTGIAASATGFVLHQNVLIVSGMLVGASGTLLTLMMARSMGRSVANVIFGAFGQVVVSGDVAAAAGDGQVRSASAEDVAVMLAYARRVIIIPGYGLAVAQ